MASKAWSVGAWALEAEREDAEERERAAAQAANPQSFPSLKEAAAAKPKKKKPVPIPLAQFTADSYSSAVPAAAAGRLTPDEMLRLPTGPKERTPEELEYGRLGGGFRSYGAGGGGPRGGAGGFPSRRSDDADGGSWGGGGRRPYGGGFDDEQRRGPQARAAEFDQPSRADEVDNWAAGKKAMAPPGNYGQQDRYDSFGSGGIGGPSRADEVENWSFGKKPAVAAASRYPSFGSGFRDSSSGMDSGLWGRGGGGGSLNGERPRLVLDPPKAGGDAAGTANEPARTRPSPFGAARPREEILAEKGVDWRKVDSEIEVKKTSRPTSSHSSRPSSAQSGRVGSPGSQEIEGAVRARPIVNPFGNAKPREVLLQEQGKDWRKIDMELEHRAVERPETNEEKVLKEEISQLKKKLTRASEGDLQSELAQSSADEVTRLREEMLHKEKELEQLMLQLDDKVRFGQKASSNMPRPSSGAGRSSVSSDSRPHSRSGMPEESRSMEFMERPRSRGGIGGDVWAKPMDDRQGFQGAADRGFFGNRNLDRPRARERW